MFHCRVITTAGDEAKLEKARALGAATAFTITTERYPTKCERSQTKKE